MIRNRKLEDSVYKYIRTFQHDHIYTPNVIQYFSDKYSNDKILHAIKHLLVNKRIIKERVKANYYYKTI